MNNRTNTRQPVKQRASRTVDHYRQIAPVPTNQGIYQEQEDEEILDDYYPPRMPSSARRYTSSRGEQVYERGNQRIVVHEGKPKRKIHWMTLIGIGMIIALLCVIAVNMLSTWWSNHQAYSQFGYPRTSQTDAIVYPGDSATHPSHYIFLNLSGTILIIELPHDDSKKAKIYKGPSLYSDAADLTPVTGQFKQVDGHTQLILHIGDQRVIYINDGHEFVPQK